MLLTIKELISLISQIPNHSREEGSLILVTSENRNGKTTAEIAFDIEDDGDDRFRIYNDGNLKCETVDAGVAALVFNYLSTK